MSNQTNDWSARLLDGVKTFAKSETDGMGAVARFVRDDIMPYIGMRMQEGALVWRPDSDEAMKDILRDLYQTASVESLKGLKRGSTDWNRIKNVQGKFARGLAFYRATAILAQRHEIAVIWDAKPQPLFPLDWFVPEGAERIVSVNKKGDVITPTHAAISGTQQLGMTIQKEGAEETEAHPFTISEASILRAYKGKVEREASEDAEDVDPSDAKSFGGALEVAANYLNAADYAISGEIADVFLDMVRAYAAASEANRSMLLSIATEVVVVDAKGEAVNG
jgi:hypothetical protein